MAENDNIELKIGIGADITKLEADIEKAKKSIADVGKTPVKIEVDTGNATDKLSFLKEQMAKIRKTTGATDMSVRVDTNAAGEVAKGVITYTNALGEAKSETYKLVSVVDEATGEVTQKFQAVGESFSSSTTKVAQFNEGVNSVKNTLDSFMLKNADIADQIGMDELVAKFEDLRNSADADVTAIQRFKNELGAAKVKAEEIRIAQRGGAAESKAALQEQTAQEQALAQLRSFYTSNYRQQQERITEIYRKQNAIIQAKIIQEKRITSENSKQKIAALQLQQTTLKTTAYKAKLSVYAKDLAAYINKAKNNMSGMQGYARSTANIVKGIILSQAFYRTMGAIKGIVSDAWELSQAINTAEATFSGMLTGGQEAAQGLLEVLKQEAINTPFDLNNLLQAARLITAYGIKAENTMFIMRAIEKATAASGDSSKMEPIARALGQIYTRGKVVTQEINQLQEAGIAAGDILKEELGLPDSIGKDWASLNIDANTAINAIVRGIDKKYGKALENMAKTTQQKISNMKESFALIASSLTDPVRRAVDTLIDTITPRLERVYQAIQAVGLGNALKSILPPEIFNGAINAIDKIVRAAQALYIVFQQLRPLLSAVLGAFAWYGQILYNIFISVVAAMGMFGQSVSDVSSVEVALRRVLGIMLAIKGAMLLIAAITKIWGVMVMAIKGVIFAIQGVVIAIQSLYAFMSVVGVALGSSMFPLIATLLVVIGLVAALAGTLHSIVGAVKNVGKALSNLGGGTNLKNMFGDMTGGMQKSIDAYNDKVTKQNAAMSKELVENEKKQTNSVKDAANSTKKAIKDLISFDEVYKLSKAAESGGGGGADIDVGNAEITAGTLDIGGIFNGVGGIDVGVQGLDLTELQEALGELKKEVPTKSIALLTAAAGALGLMSVGKKLGSGLGKVIGGGLGKAAGGQSFPQMGTDTIDALNTETGKISPKLTSLAKNLAMGIVIIAEVAAAALLIVGAIWALGKMLVKVGEAWQPVIENAGTIAIAMGVGTALLAGIGLATSALGGVGTSLMLSMAIGTIILAEAGVVAALFMAEIWALGKMLEQVGIAWEPVIKNAGTIAIAVGIGTALLVLIGAAVAGLGSVGASLIMNMAIGTIILAEAGVAAALFMAEIWALGKMLEQVGIAWEPVIKNAGTIAIAVVTGTVLLALIGAAVAGLGAATIASAGLLPVAIGLGTIMLAQVGIAAGLFIAEIWAVGKGLEKIGIAWQPVLDNSDMIKKAIKEGTKLLVAVGAVVAALGVASVASAGLLPVAIGLGTALLVELSNAFIAFTKSLVRVADELSYNLAPALENLNAKLPSLSSDMKNFTNFMKEFANQVVSYTKTSVIAGLSATIDTVIGFFTKDPFKKLSQDVSKIYTQLLDLNAKFRIANPELQYAYRLLSDYQTFMNDVATIMRDNSNTSLPSQMFVNLKEVGKKLVTGFADGITTNKGTATNAMQALGNSVVKTMQGINGTTEGAKIAKDMATGINNNKYLVNDGFKTLLNNMLSTMEKFTSKIASALNSMLSGFASTMRNMSINSDGKVNYKSMSGTSITRLADGGQVQRAAKGLQMFKKPTMVAPNVEAGEAGAEIVFPLENTAFIKAFADDISKRVNNLSVQQSAQRINAQMEQARVGIARSSSFTAPSAKEISDAIRSWLTPQMKSLHDALEQDRVVNITVPNTSNALWRTILSELKAVNASSGSRGFAKVS